MKKGYNHTEMSAKTCNEKGCDKRLKNVWLKIVDQTI